MIPAVAIPLYLVVLCTASVAWQFGPRRPADVSGYPVATITALLVVAVPTALQLTVAPALLGVLQRDGNTLFSGQPWRIATSLVVQDGGWPGALFNLAALAWIGLMAETVWGSGRWTIIALCSGIGAQAWGWLVQPAGAGNSVVVFGLAASLLVHAWAVPGTAARIASVTGLLAAAVLLVGGDLHGGAAAIGTVVAVLLLRRASRGLVRGPARS